MSDDAPKDWQEQFQKILGAVQQAIKQAVQEAATQQDAPKKFDLEKFLGQTTPAFASMFMQALRDDAEAVYTAVGIYGPRPETRRIPRCNAVRLSRDINSAFHDYCDRLHGLAKQDIVRYALQDSEIPVIAKINKFTGDLEESHTLTRREFLGFELIPVTFEDVIHVRKDSYDIALDE